MAATDPPTHRQLAYIKQLAYNRGISFIPPRNRGEASELIHQLSDLTPSPTFEIHADRDATSALHRRRTHPSSSSSPHPDEITGYGSHAHSAQHTPAVAALTPSHPLQPTRRRSLQPDQPHSPLHQSRLLELADTPVHLRRASHRLAHRGTLRPISSRHPGPGSRTS